MRRVFRRRDALMMMAGGVGTAAVLGPVVRANAEDQSVTMYVLPGALTGPDGKGHDSFVPSSFVVKAGSPVRLQVINYDTGAHTVTAPDLGLNLQVNPGTKAGGKTTPVTTTTTFTPAKTGTYRWFCGLQCDGPSHWAMDAGYAGPGKEGYMAGFIVVM